MGKKYDFLKEELARNPVRDLLVINDRLVRQKYFEETHDVLKKIDGMEQKIRNFHSKDQKLFEQWYDLTFRDEKDGVDRAQREFRSLVRFHNWVVATARILDIGMAEAYALMKEEEARYLKGNAEEKSRIDQDRAERDEFIEADSQERYNEEPRFEGEGGEDEEEAGAHLSQVLTRLEDLVLPEDREPGLGMQARMDRLMDLSDDEFRYWLDDDEAAFLLFDISLSWSESQRDESFFLRVWKLMSRGQKKTFSEVYYALTGQSIDALLRRMDRSRQEEDTSEDDFEFNEEFINSGQRRPSDPKISPFQEEKLKGLYRKLIRKLHPDLQSSAPVGEQAEWSQRTWDLVQRAYNEKDVGSLEKLFSVTLLRLNALEQLTLDEIQQAKGWLQKDLAGLEREAKQLKKSMAWGFSARRDQSSLTRKIRQEFDRSLRVVQEQIESLKHEHKVLEMLFAEEPPRRREKKRNVSRRPTGKRRSRASARRGSDDQNHDKMF